MLTSTQLLNSKHISLSPTKKTSTFSFLIQNKFLYSSQSINTTSNNILHNTRHTSLLPLFRPSRSNPRPTKRSNRFTHLLLHIPHRPWNRHYMRLQHRLNFECTQYQLGRNSSSHILRTTYRKRLYQKSKCKG